MSFSQSYFANMEKVLLALSGVAGSAGHSVIKGSAREYFVRAFLSKSISPLWSIGSGEIIHQDSPAWGKRNQIDVVVYNRQLPQFEYNPGSLAFLVEGVAAFIEVKTKLTKANLKTAVKTTRQIKEYPFEITQRINPNGLVKTPRPYSFLFAFDGCKVETLIRWMVEIHEELNISLDKLVATPPMERVNYNNLSLDGVYILNRGYVHIDTEPFQHGIKVKELNPTYIWNYGKSDTLMMLWIYINYVTRMLSWNHFELTDYLPEIGRQLSDGIDL